MIILKMGWKWIGGPVSIAFVPLDCAVIHATTAVDCKVKKEYSATSTYIHTSE